MFKKTVTGYICLLGILALLFTSCQEDPDMETAASAPFVAEKPDVTVKNGMLHFKDQSTWAATIQKMQGAEDYSAYVASLGFENSLLNKYDLIKERDEELDDYFREGKLPEILDDLFASLLNEYAMVKIGQTLYKVTDEYTFSVVDQDGSMIEQFEDVSSWRKLPEVDKFENVDNMVGRTMVVEEEVNGAKTTARFQGDTWYAKEHYPYRVKVGA